METITITQVAGKSHYKIVSNKVQFLWDYRFLWPVQIEDVQKNGSVVLSLYNGDRWDLTFDGSEDTIKVASVLTTVPTDNDNLATLIANLKG